MADSVRSQLLHGVAWNFIEKVLLEGIRFAIGIILARLLLPSDYGLIGMLAIFISISDVFIEGGLSTAIIQRKNCQDIDYSTAFVSNVVMSIIIYAILFVSAPLIADFYHEPILTDLTRVFALNFILGSFNIVQRARLTSKVDFKPLAQIKVISVIIGGIVGISMAYCGFGVWSLVGQTICVTIVSIFLFPLYSKWKPSIKFSKTSFNSLFGFGSKLLITGIYSVIMNNISTICVGRAYRSSQLGFYTRAHQFPSLISLTVSNVLGTVTFPVLSHLQDSPDHMVSVYRKVLYLTAMAIFPVMILGALLARPLIIVLLTEKWLPCLLMMQWLFGARIFTPLSAINMNILNAVGRSDLYMKLDFSKAPLTILALVITIPLGVEAICIGQFFTSFICFFINAYLPGKLFGYGAWQQIKDWRYILLSLVLMALPVSLCLYIFDNAWLQLFVGGSLGIAAYLACCFKLGVINDEMIEFVKSKKGKSYDRTQNN